MLTVLWKLFIPACCDVPLRVAYDLIEADHGVVDGMLREEIVAAYPEEFRCWRNLEEAFIDSR